MVDIIAAMSLIVIVLALLLEQVRPPPTSGWWRDVVDQWIEMVRRNVDAGDRSHAWLAWSIAAGLPAVFTALVHVLIAHFLGWPLALVWSVVVLYLTVGFRRFSHHFADVRQALEEDDLDLARARYTAWRHEPAPMSRDELVRAIIAQGLFEAHVHVLGFCSGTSLVLPSGLVRQVPFSTI